MVEVAPFKALEYNPERVDLARVVSPPFDVITPAELARLRAASPYNLVHLTLPGDAPDPFHESGERFREWLEQGVLRTERREVLYAYECAFEQRGQPKRMRGVLLLLRLDPEYQQVVPHEDTFPRPTVARVRLMEATAADLEPIQLLYAGASAETALWAHVDGSRRPADVTLAGSDGAVHRYWRISDPAVAGTLVQAFKGRKAYIADGHHRYAAALAYAARRREASYKPPRTAAWDWKLSLLVNMGDPGLHIQPTHRVVLRAPHASGPRLVERWTKEFRVERVAVDAKGPVQDLTRRVDERPVPTVGAWLGGAHAYLLEAREAVVPAETLPGRSLTFRGLDVVHLQYVALAQGMGVPEERWAEDVLYTRSDAEATQRVAEGQAVAVLVHRATRLQQLRAIADAGERMPQKSTYFVPKTLSGVAMNLIGRPEAGPPKPRYTS